MHVHIEAEKTNGMNGRTFPALYLGLTGNLQGAVKAWDINTRCIKKAKIFDVAPVPSSVIDSVNKWGLKNQKETKTKMGKFLDRLKHNFTWENDESMTSQKSH